jgi:hypothetical protein
MGKPRQVKKKQLYRQFLKTRKVIRNPLRIVKFKRPKWLRLKRVIPKSHFYRIGRFRGSINFHRRKYRNIYKTTPKFKDFFINGIRIGAWFKLTKSFRSRWRNNLCLKLDYGSLLRRTSGYEDKTQEELLIRRFFSLHYRLGYILLSKRYYGSYAEIQQKLNYGLVKIIGEENTSNNLLELKKGDVVSIQDKDIKLRFIRVNKKMRRSRSFAKREYFENIYKRFTSQRNKFMLRNAYWQNRIRQRKTKSFSAKEVRSKLNGVRKKMTINLKNYETRRVSLHSKFAVFYRERLRGRSKKGWKRKWLDYRGWQQRQLRRKLARVNLALFKIRFMSNRWRRRLSHRYVSDLKHKSKRQYLPFMEEDPYSQTLAIIKSPGDLSREDCVLINPVSRQLAKPSFLRARNSLRLQSI